jgi:DNA gyrase/topoisomerase IV subunit A
LTQFIKAPDFPTSATIINPQDMLDMYSTGKGKIIIRSKYHIENDEKLKRIVFTEIPYQANKSKICETIANLIIEKDSILKSVIDIRDETDRDGMRIVVEIKKSTDENLVLARLFKRTNLQMNYNSIFLAIVNDEPKILNLKDILKYYIEHQKEVLTRRTKFELEKSQKRLHILEGLRIAILNMDKTIELIRSSKSKNEAKDKLVSILKLDEEQSQAILDMRLHRLTGLELESIENEYNELVTLTKHLNSILNNTDFVSVQNLVYELLKHVRYDDDGIDENTKIEYLGLQIGSAQIKDLLEATVFKVIIQQDTSLESIQKAFDSSFSNTMIPLMLDHSVERIGYFKDYFDVCFAGDYSWMKKSKKSLEMI